MKITQLFVIFAILLLPTIAKAESEFTRTTDIIEVEDCLDKDDKPIPCEEDIPTTTSKEDGIIVIDQAENSPSKTPNQTVQAEEKEVIQEFDNSELEGSPVKKPSGLVDTISTYLNSFFLWIKSWF